MVHAKVKYLFSANMNNFMQGAKFSDTSVNRPLDLMLVAAAYLTLQLQAAVFLRPNGDEQNAVGIAAIYATTGRVEVTKPGLSVISHTPAGGLVHAAFSLGGTTALTVQQARFVSLFLALVGTAVLVGTVSAVVGKRFALWYLLAYGLSPWTVYHTARTWEPALLIFTTCLALAAALRLSRRPSRLWSGIFGYSLAAMPQAYASFVIPMLAHLSHLARKMLKIWWPAVMIGVTVGSITLWPNLFPRSLNPVSNAVNTSSHRDAYFGWGLVHGYPVLRATGYWVRMGSADLNRLVRENSYYRGLRSSKTLGGRVAFIALQCLLALSFLSVVLSGAATLWLFRAVKAGALPEPKRWLGVHAALAFGSLILASAAAPICIQSFHAAAALTAAAIPVAAWCEHQWDHGGEKWRWAIVATWAVRIAVTLIVILGADLGSLV